MKKSNEPFRCKKIKWLNEYELPKTLNSIVVKHEELLQYLNSPTAVYLFDFDKNRGGWTFANKMRFWYEDHYYFIGYGSMLIENYGKTWLLFKEEVDYEDIPTIEEERLKLIA